MKREDDGPKHTGVIGAAIVTALFGTIMWIFPDTRQPPPGLEGALAVVVTVIIGAVKAWLNGRDRP